MAKRNGKRMHEEMEHVDNIYEVIGDPIPRQLYGFDQQNMDNAIGINTPIFSFIIFFSLFSFLYILRLYH